VAPAGDVCGLRGFSDNQLSNQIGMVGAHVPVGSQFTARRETLRAPMRRLEARF
jgi:hypothetical protein